MYFLWKILIIHQVDMLWQMAASSVWAYRREGSQVGLHGDMGYLVNFPTQRLLEKIKITSTFKTSKKEDPGK